MPKNETSVSYSPWFLDQVKKKNIKTLSIQGIEVRGELAQRSSSSSPSSVTPHAQVPQFITYFPSEASI